MDNTVIGIHYHAGTFTVATRRNRIFGAIKQRANITDGEALAWVLDLTNLHRHEFPMVHICGDDAHRIMDSIRRANIPANLFNWFASVNNTDFANLGSMQFSELRGQINSGLRIGVSDDALTADLEAFEEVGSGGKVEYLRPNKVAEALGRFPARALAALLANQFSAAPSAEYRPLASGYVPLQQRTRGHDPFASS